MCNFESARICLSLVSRKDWNETIFLYIDVGFILRSVEGRRIGVALAFSENSETLAKCTNHFCFWGKCDSNLFCAILVCFSTSLLYDAFHCSKC
jgi:hypothetical protein